MFNLFEKTRKGGAVTPQQAKKIMDENPGAVVLDVRTPEEHRQIRIEPSKLIPLDELVARAPAELADKQATILIYCHSGARAGSAAQLLAKMGYENVYNFGGIMQWPFGTVRG